jgi:DNA-binding beta-propeller fold protein YncE
MKPALVLAIIGLACAAQATQDLPLKLVQSIALRGVKGRFDHFAIDTKGQRLFVAGLANNTLEIIDLAAGKRVKSVSGMSKPTGLLFLPGVNEILVANGGDGSLKILSGADYRILGNLPNLADADNLRFDPETKLAWLGYGDGSLGVIDVTTASIAGRVELSAHPESFQLERQGNRIFVNLPDADQIVVINRTKRSVTERWPMASFKANFPMALDEAHSRLFVGCRQPPRLVILNTMTGKPVSDVALSGDIDDLFFDTKRKRLYLSCGEGFIDTVEQITADTYQSMGKIPTARGARTSFFSPDLDRLYLAVPNQEAQQAEIRVYQPQ